VGGSGGPYTQGWLVRLLPYLKTRRWQSAVAGDDRTGYLTPWETTLRNPELGKPFGGSRKPFAGLTSDALPSSASQVAFVWGYYGTDFDYQFLGGVLAVSQDRDSGAVRPRVGWAVRPAPRA
jgi:hypothetical protein